jgi:hypothetical protein
VSLPAVLGIALLLVGALLRPLAFDRSSAWIKDLPISTRVGLLAVPTASAFAAVILLAIHQPK